MTQASWSEAIEMVEPHVFRISTPRGSGSGFLISNSSQNDICGVATAAHVVNLAHYWEEPIRIDHVALGKSLVVRSNERAVILDSARDTAALIFNRGELTLPQILLSLAPKDMFLKVGNAIGWLGFPAIPAANLCFFSGTVSAWIQEYSAYLVDGVAINGVSGGPAPYATTVNDQSLVHVMGVVSAYVPNRATGETLPGLSVVRDVSQFHELAPTFASLDQARSAESPPEPPPPAPESGISDGDVHRTT